MTGAVVDGGYYTQAAIFLRILKKSFQTFQSFQSALTGF
jgi:hypothetical protein